MRLSIDLKFNLVVSKEDIVLITNLNKNETIVSKG